MKPESLIEIEKPPTAMMSATAAVY